MNRIASKFKAAERHYPPCIRACQEQLEADVRRAVEVEWCMVVVALVTLSDQP